MQLYSDETEHTSNNSKLLLEGNKVFQQIESYRDISNSDQMDAIIENLVINRGFVMDKEKEKTLKFTNSTEPDTTYFVWLESPGIMKLIHRYVGEVY